MVAVLAGMADENVPPSPAPQPAPGNPPPSPAPAPPPEPRPAPQAPPVAEAVVNGKTEREAQLERDVEALNKKLKDTELTVAERDDVIRQLKDLKAEPTPAPKKKKGRLTFFSEED
jgi:hypothetical protein